MPSQFLRYKKTIDRFLLQYLSEKQKDLRSVNLWGDTVSSYIQKFILKGKSIRGSLILYITELYGKQITKDSVILAAYCELIHSGLLIHDDIMDQDRMRRGLPSLYSYIETIGKSKHVSKPGMYGQHMAIAGGDALFFIASELLGGLRNAVSRSEILKRTNKEFANVCIAQMQDYAYSLGSKIPTEQDILVLYRYKTARYTFSLPFELGGILAGLTHSELIKLSRIGEQFGLLFQISDDLLNLKGDPDITGKPILSDIREGKKILPLVYFMMHAGNTDRHTVDGLLKKTIRGDKDIRTILSLFDKYQISSYIQKKIENIRTDTHKDIQNLKVSEYNKMTLTKISEYIIGRDK